MKNFQITSSDIRFYFKQNKSYYFAVLFSSLIGVIVGIVLILTSDGYLNLMTSDNKILYPFINGTMNLGEIFWNKFSFFICPMLLIFLLCLNYYSGLFTYVFLGYQSALFVMSIASVVSFYGFSGVLKVLFIMAPVNVIYFLILIFFSVSCLSRSYSALKNHKFTYGFLEDNFYYKLIFSIVSVLVLVVLAVIIYPLFLKNTIFIII